MKNRILVFGSIVTVFIIVLTSFTSVVGFQPVKSNSCRVSLLFSIRAKRALDNENQDSIISNYIGKEKGIIISLPLRDYKTVLLQRAIDMISKMDDITFSKFVDRIKHLNSDEIVTMLYQLRNNPEMLRKLELIVCDNVLGDFDSEDIFITVAGDWEPGCIIYSFFYLIAYFIFQILCHSHAPPTL